jgi:hypothetical protein
MKKEYLSPTEFESFLDGQQGERSISEFIRERPQILYWTVSGRGGHCRYVFREFPLGSSYVADFAVVNSYSGVWEVKFVELEPVNHKLFTKAGVPSQRLAGAVKQIDDWAAYFDQNKHQVRADLVRWAKTKDILGYSEGERPCNFSGHRLADPSTNLFESFHIFIGRRGATSEVDHSRKATMSRRHNVEVATYDRLVDLVKYRYANVQAWQLDA